MHHILGMQPKLAKAYYTFKDAPSQFTHHILGMESKIPRPTTHPKMHQVSKKYRVKLCITSLGWSHKSVKTKRDKCFTVKRAKNTRFFLLSQDSQTIKSEANNSIFAVRFCSKFMCRSFRSVHLPRNHSSSVNIVACKIRLPIQCNHLTPRGPRIRRKIHHPVHYQFYHVLALQSLIQHDILCQDHHELHNARKTTWLEPHNNN